MDKKFNTYQLHLKENALKNGISGSKSLEFQFENHDNIMQLVELVKDKNLFKEQSDNIEFLVGLKLFSEVMLRNRKHEMFTEFGPEFREFMKKFKSHVKMADTI
ncbi:DUF3861 domain-containing protein [Flagellimonas okinawensis]|uniref:DUF3861 domain-containing protein n=1 Tax=Flagellimonas okinawensis TaxID=3031324 RepID=A0ABT5XJN1_9FLAO|nr:DUF3861 domain-containing protein [[Muricauda] okinawensis]MDF0706089.1 DUF3861 domain-containing protein [[Muricauda] okinawensis]